MWLPNSLLDTSPSQADTRIRDEMCWEGKRTRGFCFLDGSAAARDGRNLEPNVPGEITN